MAEKVIIHCDKCDSTDVLHEQVKGPPIEVHKTMTEMAQQSKINITNALYIYTPYRMVCKDCGHIVKYSV